MASKKFEQPLNVPFIGKDHLEYSHGQERSAAAESLVQQEFGDLGQLHVSNYQVTLGDRTLIDLDQSEPVKPVASTPAGGHFRDANPQNKHTIKEGTPVELESVFRLRQINNGEGLRIAVQSPLLIAQTKVLRDLLNELKNYSANNFEIDLTLCTDMSITGLGILLLIHKNLDAHCKHITLLNSKPAILQLLRWAGMEQYFTLQAA